MRRRLIPLLLVMTLALPVIAAARPASAGVLFSSIPSPLPGNVDSEGPEAYSFREIGDAIGFPAGTGGALTTVKVVLSSWACTSGNWFNPAPGSGACLTNPRATFNQPITMNIYAVDTSNPAVPKAGALITTQTTTFQIPYRPSSDAVHCGPSGTPGGDGKQWYNPVDNRCYHGLAVPIVFDFTGQSPVSLPSEVVVGVSFNTTDAGPAPLGQKPCSTTSAGCPYDSLNVSTYGDVFSNFDGALPLSSSVLDPNGIFVNYISNANACNRSTTPGVLEDDTVPNNGEPATELCFTGYHPEIEIDGVCGRFGQPRCPSMIGGQVNQPHDFGHGDFGEGRDD